MSLVLVLVYVGAIVVLVLFALMVTRAPIGPDTAHTVGWPRRIGGALGAAVAVLLGAVLVPSWGRIGWGHQTGRGRLRRRWPRTSSACGSGPFEISLLLLAALVAAPRHLRFGRDETEVPS